MSGGDGEQRPDAPGTKPIAQEEDAMNSLIPGARASYNTVCRINLRELGALLLSMLVAGIGLWLFSGALPAVSAGPMPTGRQQVVPARTQAATLISTGGPDFSTRRYFGSPRDYTFSVTVGDMNGDGALDIVGGNAGHPNVVYLNDGVGNFFAGTVNCAAPPANVRCFGTGSDDTRSVAVADMNGDGVLDILVGNAGQPNVVYLNDGAGDFHTGAVNCAAPPENVRCFGTGSDQSGSVAVSDMNGDGALDIVVGNEGSPESGEQNVVYLNDEEGGFHYGAVDCTTPPANVRCFGTGADHTQSLAVADMNSDGAVDIVLGNSFMGYGRQSMVYLNDGGGDFYAGPVNCIIPPENVRCFGTGADATEGVAVGDVNGDDVLDIIIANWNQQSVFYLNDGTGNFAVARNLGSGASGARGVAVGDMNGDGALDILIGNDSQPHVLYLNDGAGNYYTGTVNCAVPTANVICLGTWAYLASVTVADMNGDGALDVVAGSFTQQSVVYLNDETGDWIYTSAFGSDSSLGVAVGDMNSDGTLDIVAGNGDGQGAVYLNDGAGNFDYGMLDCANLPASVRCFGTGSDYTMGVAVGDMNGDGALDIVAGNHDRQSAVYLNDGAGDFHYGAVDCAGPPADMRCFGAGSDNATSVAVGDVNGDGALDIVVGNGELGFFTAQNIVYLNDGAGSFHYGVLDCASPPTNVRCLGTGLDNTLSIAVGDMNGDGALDIVVGNDSYFSGGPSTVYLNDGTGNFTVAHPFGTGADQTWSVAVADMNGDSALDIVVGNRSQQNIVYLNDGAGEFSNAGAYTRWFGTGMDATAITAVGDMNGDGALDIVVGNSGQQNVVYLNDGTGNLGAAYTFGTWDWAAYSRLAVGDVNGDGALDIVGGYKSAHKVVYLNGLSGLSRLANNVPRVALTRLNPLVNANFVYTDTMSRTTAIPLTYTLFDREGDSVGAIRALYSADGGGRWLPAVAASNTITTNLPTFGTALSFDGLNDYVGIVTPTVPISNSHYSLAAWIKPDTMGARGIVGWGNYGTVNQVNALRLTDNGLVNYWWGNDLNIVTGPLTGTWHHVAATFDGMTRTIYLDGVVVGSDMPTGHNVPDGRNFQIGTTFNVEHFDGQIDEMRIYDRALSAAEIRVSMTQVVTSTAPGLVAYWRFNEGRGTTICDQTPNHNNGTLVDGPTWTRVAFPYVYHWDTFASGFFGQSDNVVFRIEAYPSLKPMVNGVPGPYQHPYASATTFPFRVRGTQVRVVSETITGTVPIPDAIVYRLPAGQSAGGAPVANQAGVPFRTDSQGYLQGRGEIAIGDRLLALAPVYDDHHYAGALELDGQDDYAIQSPLHSAPITATTVAFWMRSDDTAGSGTPLSYATPDEADALLITDYNDLTIYRGASYVQTGISTADGAWHHIAVTWRSSDGQVRLYKDGTAAFTGTLTTTALITGGSLVLGQDQDSLGGGFDPAQAFAGSLDEVSIWRVARSAAEIQADMFRSLSGAEPGLVAYWPFDDDSDTTAFDHAGQGNDATLYGATWAGESLGGYTIYHTNGQPTATGLEAFTVTGPGVQELHVSAEHPLALFDLDVSLEWDAHNDPIYLDQLTFDLQRASRFLYDFSDGQAALGQVTVHQNSDDWLPAHVAIQASNRLQPYAVQGGIVFTPTVDAQHGDIVYDMGQVRMGSTWNRYGDPGQGQGLDWQLALAHELSHFLFYQDDVYLGLDEEGLLIPVDTCTGSAMGDVYLPDNTEFVYDEGHWTADCADTLANRTLDRTEWETMRLWYPWLVTPIITNTGPSLMPFDLTTVSVLDPITPTAALEDPTFYADYAGGVDSSSQARAFILRDEYGDVEGYDYVIDLGSPATGEQNRVLARGAQPGDRLCLFDPAQRQYGCEVVELGDNRLVLEGDESWTPALRLSPVTSQTIHIEVSGLPLTFTLLARLYPEYEVGSAVISLTQDAAVYSGTFRLDYPPLAGHVQVWVDEEATETDPRREIMAAYAIGGDPGGYRGGGPLSRSRGPLSRSRGPLSRSRGPLSRSRGPLSRSRGAPLGSSDGELIFFVENPLTFAEGELYAIQSAGSLPTLPPGKVAIGQGYSLVASPNVTQAITSSISFRYLSMDVLAEGVDEDELAIHFWDTGRQRWRTLDTVLDTYYNMASAAGQGSGVYALLAGVTIPDVAAVTPPAATNDVTTTLVISGGYFLEPVEVALVGPTATYSLPLLSVSPYSITAEVTRGLPAREYEVVVAKRREGVSPIPGTFALYAPGPAGACFYDYFESGVSRWQPGGEWAIGILPSGERAVTDSPRGNYDNAIPPEITHTTTITSVPFSLGGCPEPVLTFRHDYVIAKLGTSVDMGRVEISDDGGASWAVLAGYSGGGPYPPGRGPDDVPSPEWANVDWKEVRLSLHGYNGTVRLRLSLEVDQAISDKGWVLDDVVVRPASLVPHRTADLQVGVAHEGSGAIIAGGLVTYTLTVTNAGPDTVNAVVTDTFPITYTALAWCSGECSGTGPVAWSLADFTGTQTFTLVLSTSASYSGTLTNSAVVTPTTPYAVDLVPENNSDSVDILVRYFMADLQVGVAHEGSGAIIAGGLVTYTLTVTNAGPDRVDAVVTDTFPITYTALAWCSGECSGMGPVAWSLPAFTGTQSFTLVLSTSAFFSGTLVDSAVVILTTPYAVDSVPGNNQSSDTVWVSTPSEIRVYLPLILKQGGDD